MKLLFVLEDNFPESGACTSLIGNIIFSGRLVEKVESISVLALKDKYTPNNRFWHKGIAVYNSTIMSKVSLSQYKQIIFKHPFSVIKGIYRKIHSKLAVNAVDISNSKYIEREIKKINTANFDIIIAVVGYFDVAVAALHFKEKNPSTKLVLYQVDPCSSNRSFSSNTETERKELERKLYKTADAIITTPILLNEAKGIYSEDIIAKMVSMEFPNVVPKTNLLSSQNDYIRCVFAGNIYGGIRDPRYTWKLFDNTGENIVFEMIGKMSPELQEEVSKHKIMYHGPKSLQKTQEEIANADFLINIGNSMVNQVPSKLFEYISYGKPIINICKNRNCPTLPYLEKYPYILNLFEEEEIFTEQLSLLNKFMLSNHKNRMTSDEIMQIYETCTPQYCANQMIEVLSSLK